MLNNFNLFSLISLIGPMTIILIIYKVSGLPMIEKLQYEKHKDDILYKKYIKNTPCLIPFIGKKGLYKNLK
jgi:steroid 5-alpha reductase family enzyme